jgi:hypothetical protein
MEDLGPRAPNGLLLIAFIRDMVALVRTSHRIKKYKRQRGLTEKRPIPEWERIMENEP